MISHALKNILRTGAVVGLALFAMRASRADIIPELQTVAANGSGQFTWTYQVDLTNDEMLKKGNFFTIYDFAGYMPGSNFQPANWVFSSANVGKTPSKVVPTDDPNIPNLTWTYTGPKTGPGPIDLGLFGADSKYGKTQVGQFAAEAIKYAPGKPGNGKPVDNVGSLGVPMATIPEPGALALLLPGLAPIGLALRSRTRRA